MKTDLSKYDNSWYHPGAGMLKRLVWYFVNILLFTHGLFPFSGLKVFVLKIFGGTIGRGVFIKPCVNIKYPWNLQIGDHVWIGENVWIDNLATVKIGAHVCLSQGAMLLTGNHDFTKTAFDLTVKGIVLEDGVWIGAKAVVCPGVTCHEHSILTVSSVATKDMEPHGIYQGNPAIMVKKRAFR